MATKPKPWTAPEDEMLRRQWSTDVPAVAIAASLGRTEEAVISRANKKFKLRRPAAWPQHEIDALRRLVAAGKSECEIATYLPRHTPKAILSRIHALGLRGSVAAAIAESWGVLTPYEIAERVYGTHRAVIRVYSTAILTGMDMAEAWPARVVDRIRELYVGEGLSTVAVARVMRDVFPGTRGDATVDKIVRLHAMRPAERKGRFAAVAAKWKREREARADLAAKYGLPGDLLPRQLLILVALTGGPMLRTELNAATGGNVSAPMYRGNRYARTSLMGDLKRRGLVASVEDGPSAAGRGKARYMLTTTAINMLSQAPAQEATR